MIMMPDDAGWWWLWCRIMMMTHDAPGFFKHLFNLWTNTSSSRPSGASKPPSHRTSRESNWKRKLNITQLSLFLLLFRQHHLYQNKTLVSLYCLTSHQANNSKKNLRSTQFGSKENSGFSFGDETRQTRWSALPSILRLHVRWRLLIMIDQDHPDNDIVHDKLSDHGYSSLPKRYQKSDGLQVQLCWVGARRHESWDP